MVYEGINSLSLDDLSLGAFRYNHLPMLIGPANESEADLTSSWEVDTWSLTGAFSIDLDSTAGARIIRSWRATDGTMDPDRIVSCNVSDKWTINGTEGTFPRYKMNGSGAQSAGSDHVTGILLLGNLHVQKWTLTQGDTTRFDLNEDALGVAGYFRVYYTSVGADYTLDLLKGLRTISPRLTIGLETNSGATLETGATGYIMTTTSDFDTDGDADHKLVRLRDAGGSVHQMHLRTPDLWAQIEDTSNPDDVVFVYTLADLAEGKYVETRASDGSLQKGIPVDKTTTLANYTSAGDSSKLYLQWSDSGWNSITNSSGTLAKAGSWFALSRSPLMVANPVKIPSYRSCAGNGVPSIRSA